MARPKFSYDPKNIRSSGSFSYSTSYKPTEYKGYTAERPTYSTNAVAPTYDFNAKEPTYSGYSAKKPTYTNTAKAPTWSYNKKTPTFNSQYTKQISDIADSIINRAAFSYNAQNDPLYQQYTDTYRRNGENAMASTLGRIASASGGNISSAAQNAAQQNYNEYMQGLNDKLPELYQIAYGMYQDEGNNLRNNVNLLQNLDNTDYGRYRDSVSDYMNDRAFNRNIYESDLNQYNTDRNFGYGQYRDAMSDYLNDRSFDYGKYRDSMSDFQNDRAYALNKYGIDLGQYNTDRNFDYGRYRDSMSDYLNDRNFDYSMYADWENRQRQDDLDKLNAADTVWDNNFSRNQALDNYAYNVANTNYDADLADYVDQLKLAQAAASASSSGGSGGRTSSSSKGQSESTQSGGEPSFSMPNVVKYFGPTSMENVVDMVDAGFIEEKTDSKGNLTLDVTPQGKAYAAAKAEDKANQEFLDIVTHKNYMPGDIFKADSVMKLFGK